MNIRSRLTLSHAILLCFLAAVMAVAATRLNTVAETTQVLVEEDARRTELTQAINLHAESAAGRLLLLFILEDREKRVGIYKEIDQHNAQIDQAMEALRPLMQQGELRAEFDKLLSLRKAFDAPFTATVEALETSERSTAIQLMSGETRTALRGLLQATAEMASRQQASMSNRQQNVLSSSQGAIRIVLVLGAVALVAGMLMAWRMTASIVVPLGQAVRSIDRIATGDLDSPVPTGGRDEVGQMLTSMANMRVRLRDVIESIRVNAGRVSQSSLELDAPGQRVKSGSAEQGQLAAAIESSVQTFSQGIDELSASMQTTRDEAVKARDMAKHGAAEIVIAADAIVRIAGTVEVSAQSVLHLEQSAREVTSTVGVIREIAEQTNLLALNASIEAARAGESGRGFAVVADEVRKLANRTADATTEIDRVIATINQQTQQAMRDITQGKHGMDEGTRLIRSIVAPLESLREGAQRSLDSLERLTGVVAEQVGESRAIAANVSTIVGMAEANQVAADQVARVTGDLGTTSRELQAAVSIFRV